MYVEPTKLLVESAKSKLRTNEGYSISGWGDRCTITKTFDERARVNVVVDGEFVLGRKDFKFLFGIYIIRFVSSPLFV